MMNYTCKICGSCDVLSIYEVEKIPPFQNRLFSSLQKATEVPVASVNLLECKNCSYIHNVNFENDLMTYDEEYQNAQGHSQYFQNHLNNVAEIISSNISKDSKIIEIGCGKGAFFSILEYKGYDVTGYDPAYEGNHRKIIKKYFDKNLSQKINPDVIIMRHTLEHIENPHVFLKALASGCQKNTKIFIEIPRYEWIDKNHAFWDVFHEHCNYFTEVFFQNIFSSKAKIYPVFNGQYMLVCAELGSLNFDINNKERLQSINLYKEKIKKFGDMLLTYNKNIVWGAGAKGVAFANILDPECTKIDKIIDINPKKQNKYIGLSGHQCVGPNDFDWSTVGKNDCIWIMNENYKDEILSSISSVKCNVEVL